MSDIIVTIMSDSPQTKILSRDFSLTLLIYNNLTQTFKQLFLGTCESQEEAEEFCNKNGPGHFLIYNYQTKTYGYVCPVNSGKN